MEQEGRSLYKNISKNRYFIKKESLILGITWRLRVTMVK